MEYSYQYLNHYLIFRGGYKDNVIEAIKKLTDKYIIDHKTGT